MNCPLPFPATPGRAVTSFTDVPFSKTESDAESMNRPTLSILYYEGNLSADLRYKGGMITGVDLIIHLLGGAGTIRRMAVVAWSPTEKSATLDVSQDEACKVLREYAAKARLDAILTKSAHAA